MSKIVSDVYKDYPEQPYISKSRNIKDWEMFPDKYPYGVVERKKMVRLDEGILPGDIIMLWRIHFGNFTSDTWIPEYFEYRYGVNSTQSIELLLKKEYIRILDRKDSLHLNNAKELKGILKTKSISLSGKKEDLIHRVLENFNENELKELIPTYAYQITNLGTSVLDAHGDIIQQHGSKG